MIQQNNTVLYKGVEVRVLKINPEWKGNRTAIIDINGQMRTVAYASLKPAKNRFTPRKSDAEKLKDVLVEVQRLQDAYIQEGVVTQGMENPTDKTLVRLKAINEFIDELEAILTGKKLEV
ncbi:MAG: hypothetical protein WDZ41_01880 [Candidatus Babeliales bacterium]